MRIGAIAACLLVGCAYQAGSYRYQHHALAGNRVTLGCIDLAVARHRVTDPEGGVVIQYEFGNGCDAPARVDLAHVRVAALTADGRQVRLVPYDPNAELQPLRLDGRSYGSETIAYRDELGNDVHGACVDAASVVHQAEARWVCFGGAPPLVSFAGAP